MTTPNKRLEELAALHSLGALDDDDAKVFHAMSASADDEARAEVTAWEEVAAQLAYLARPVIAPSANVKQNLMRAIAARHAQERAFEGPADFKFINAAGITTLNTNKMEWKQHPVPGVRIKVLSENPKRSYVTMLMQVDPGTVFPEHHHTGEEDCYVISGSFTLGGKRISAGDFHHGDEASDHGVLVSEEGCLLLLVVAREDYISPLN